MGYEILSSDLYNSDSKSKKMINKLTRRGKKPKSRFKIRLKPMYIHFLIILIICLGIYFYFVHDSNFDMNLFGTHTDNTLVLGGKIINFNEKYVGDISIKSEGFLLKTKDSEFNDKSNSIKIINFSGNIYFNSSGLGLYGNAQKIKYNGITVNIDAKNFLFLSKKKTEMSVFFKQLKLDFESGNVEFDNKLEYNFDNTTFNINNFNGTMSYDKTIIFSGTVKSFSLLTVEPNVKIDYKKE